MARLSEVLDSTTFKRTACVSTSCGVKQVACGCAPTPAPTTPAPTPAPTTLAPTPGALGSDGARTRSVALCLAVAALRVLE